MRMLEPTRVENAAGTFEAYWDGKTSGGKAASPGVYFVRVTSGAKAATARLTIAR
jgi:hypothetical protein